MGAKFQHPVAFAVLFRCRGVEYYALARWRVLQRHQVKDAIPLIHIQARLQKSDGKVGIHWVIQSSQKAHPIRYAQVQLVLQFV